VTAEPVVTTVDLMSPPPPPSSSSTPSLFGTSGTSHSTPPPPPPPSPSTSKLGGDKRFIVIATDGLWDELSNEEVVGLVGAWLDGATGVLSRNEVLSRIAPSESSLSTFQGHKSRKENSNFAFTDSNLSTHLIRSVLYIYTFRRRRVADDDVFFLIARFRNALGGAKGKKIGTLLAIPPPISRRFRDDVRRSLSLSLSFSFQLTKGLRLMPTILTDYSDGGPDVQQRGRGRDARAGNGRSEADRPSRSETESQAVRVLKQKKHTHTHGI
jgi:hypothetical protein